MAASLLATAKIPFTLNVRFAAPPPPNLESLIVINSLSANPEPSSVIATVAAPAMSIVTVNEAFVLVPAPQLQTNSQLQ